MKSHQTNKKANDMLMIAHHFDKKSGIEMITVGRRNGMDVDAIKVYQADAAKTLYEKLNYSDTQKSKDEWEMYNLVYAGAKKDKPSVMAISKLHGEKHEWVKLDILFGDRADELYSEIVEGALK